MDAPAGAPAPAATDASGAAAEAAKAAAAAAPGPAAGFARRKNRGNLRKRAADDSGDEAGDGDGGGGVVRKAARAGKEQPLGFTTKRADRAEVFAFESSNQVQQKQNDALRSNDQETAHDRDSR